MTRVYVAYSFTAVFAGVLFWTTRDVQLALRAEFEDRSAEADWETIVERDIVRQRIVEGLMTGQLSLDAAVEEFCRDEGLWSRRLLAPVPGSATEEKVRRFLIGWVEQNERPGKHEVSWRLKAELTEWLARQSSSAVD